MLRMLSNKMKKRLMRSGSKNFLDRYTIVEELGTGATSTVYKVIDKHSYNYYTCKKITDRRHSAHREISVLRKLPKDSCFPQIKGTIEENNSISILTNYIHGIELFVWFDDILNSNKQLLNEDTGRMIFKQMVTMTKKLHNKGFVHLDIKLENFLISEDSSRTVSMIDFGSCHPYPKGPRFVSKIVGTRGYTPCEIYDGVYHSTTDIWSLGVCLWLLIAKCPAFDHRSFSLSKTSPANSDEFRFPTKIHYDYKQKYSISDDAFDLVCQMLTVKPQDRIDIDSILQHPWMISSKENSLLI